jgi:hypothetical protein
MTIQTHGIGWECSVCGAENLPEAWAPWSYRCGCVGCANRRDNEREAEAHAARIAAVNVDRCVGGYGYIAWEGDYDLGVVSGHGWTRLEAIQELERQWD